MKPPLSKSEARVRLATLRQAIDQYRYQYHVLNQTDISEAALDSLKHELATIESAYPDLITPDSPSQRVAGQPLAAFKKVKHAVPMISLSDVFSVEELHEWDNRWKKLRPQATTDYLVDLKLDGLAVSLVYNRGLFMVATTRGNGQVGEDVTHNVRTIEAIPLRLELNRLSPAVRRQVSAGRLEVRGEVVMLRKDFDALNRRQTKAGRPTFANPRNLAAGTIRQLDPKMMADRPLDFYAWDLVTDLGQKTLAQNYQLLRQLGIKVNPEAKVCATIDDVEQWYRQIERRRDRLPFWIDGMVIKINTRGLYTSLGTVGKTPRAATAYKFTAEQATTVVEDIVVQVGRTGALTPVAHLRPVQVAGTTVARATLHNADEIERLDVRVGDTVIIQKAGDIIPDVVKVLIELRPAKAKAFIMPKRCPVCGHEIKRKEDEVIAYCPNPHCPARQREGLYHFVSKKALDIEGLGPSTIDVLVEEGLVQTPCDIFHLSANQLEGLPLFAEKKATNLVSGIDRARRVTLDRLIYALGIRHVGEQTAIDLAQHWRSIDALSKATTEDVAAVPNVGTVVAESIAHWFRQPVNRKLVQAMVKELQVTTPPRPKSASLSGKTVVVTGTLATMSREQAHERIRQAGGKVANSVSKKTNFVVVGSDPGSKAKTAENLGVRILTEKQWQSLIER